MTRAVVIGAGSHIFEAAHRPALAANAIEVVGAHDAAPGRTEAAATALGCAAATTPAEAFAIPADLAVICTPHPVHAELVIEALESGLAVLVEKPLTSRPSEVERIERAAEAAGRPVAVAHQHRFRHEVERARALIDEGGLGSLHTVSMSASYPKRSSYYTDTAWRGTWLGEGGGVLLNQGLHDVDLLVHLFGEPARVTASLRTLTHPIETEDTADALLEWADGATATIHVTSAASLGPNRFEAFGDRGALRLSPVGLDVRLAAQGFADFAAASGGHFDTYEPGEWQRLTTAGGGGHTEVYADLLSAMRRGGSPRVGPREAGAAVRVIAAAALSSAHGRTVSLPPDPAECDALMDERIGRSRLRGNAR